MLTTFVQSVRLRTAGLRVCLQQRGKSRIKTLFFVHESALRKQRLSWWGMRMLRFRGVFADSQGKRKAVGL